MSSIPPRSQAASLWGSDIMQDHCVVRRRAYSELWRWSMMSVGIRKRSKNTKSHRMLLIDISVRMMYLYGVISFGNFAPSCPATTSGHWSRAW